MSRTIRLLAIISLALATRVGFAQPASFLYVSLEALVASGDTVFLGSIDPDASSGSGDTITVRVESVLKGKAGRTVVLKRGAYSPEFGNTDDAGQHTEYLWITRSTSPASWSVLGLRDANLKGNRQTRFPGLPILGIDLKPLKTEAEVLARVKAFLAIAPPAPTMMQIIIPSAISKEASEISATHEFMEHLSSVAQPDTPGLVAKRLVVPVVPQLEETARQSILHAENFVPLLDANVGRRTLDLPTREAIRSGEILTLRLTGISLLANFKSDQNAELLKSLLADPSIRGFARPGEIGLAKGREYPLRRAAYELLTRWGITAKPPVFVISAAGTGLPIE